MIGMVRVAGPSNFSDFGVLPKVFGYGLSIAAVPFHSQVKRLNSTKHEKAGLESWNGAAGVGNKEQLLLEFLIVHDECTHDHIGMTSQVFGHGMHDDIHAHV